MSPPTEAEVMAALASLAGGEPPDPSADVLAAAATRLQMIARAQRAGVSWNAIATATGAPNGKAAKRDAHRLARRTQQAMLADWTPLDEEVA